MPCTDLGVQRSKHRALNAKMIHKSRDFKPPRRSGNKSMNSAAARNFKYSCRPIRKRLGPGCAGPALSTQNRWHTQDTLQGRTGDLTHKLLTGFSRTELSVFTGVGFVRWVLLNHGCRNHCFMSTKHTQQRLQNTTVGGWKGKDGFPASQFS